MSVSNNTIFDDVFRTMLEKMPELVIPLINEVLGTDYPDDIPIIQKRNEHETKSGEIITDSHLFIGNRIYHIECQSTVDSMMIIRVDQHIIIWHFRRIKLCRNNAGIFHPRTPGILVITVIEKIITVITRLKMGYFNFPDSANYGIK